VGEIETQNGAETRSEAMLYMVIERFRDDAAAAVYIRFREKGRMLPDGLSYVDSWVEVNNSRCFQLMECDDVRLFEQWICHWNDLVEFEIVAVRTSKDAAASFESSVQGGKEYKTGPSSRDRFTGRQDSSRPS
jgi:hypothetical protein